MRILATQYTLTQRALEIYTAGCKAPHCKGCFNPDTWSFEQGDDLNFKIYEKIQNKIKTFPSLIDKIMIFGGEPLDNPIEEVIEFLIELGKHKLPIWLFTKRNFEDVPDSVKNLCDYIKCGRYIESLTCENNVHYGITLATSNQKIYKINKGE